MTPWDFLLPPWPLLVLYFRFPVFSALHRSAPGHSPLTSSLPWSSISSCCPSVSPLRKLFWKLEEFHLQLILLLNSGFCIQLPMDISACLCYRHLKLTMCQTKCRTLTPHSWQQLRYSGSSHQWSSPLICLTVYPQLLRKSCYLYLQSVSPGAFSTATALVQATITPHLNYCQCPNWPLNFI